MNSFGLLGVSPWEKLCMTKHSKAKMAECGDNKIRETFYLYSMAWHSKDKKPVCRLCDFHCELEEVYFGAKCLWASCHKNTLPVSENKKVSKKSLLDLWQMSNLEVVHQTIRPEVREAACWQILIRKGGDKETASGDEETWEIYSKRKTAMEAIAEFDHHIMVWPNLNFSYSASSDY